MCARLDDVDNWPALAKESNYRVEDLAHRLGVSARWLDRRFAEKFQKSPHEYLARLRFAAVKRSVRAGEQAKSISEEAGFAYVSGLSRWLKAYSGHTLRELQKGHAKTSQKGNK